ncbi:Os07g0174300 [Oryza sativa Japonica Group]|uniref:Os07g0174300 protein n=1 Tax=Oryza sativa subsp. japonica TaxID=39947 RepID=C7J4T0_ORYSJ|nr:Os07g0174300 [Oryza sativa Japonica Group]|eukprot:NP_001175071.1 Os07g0174300 [Oryza sativa Japonica Group]
MPGRAAHLAIYTLTPLGQPTGSPALPVVPARLRHRADQAYALQGDAGATGDPCYQGRRKSHLRAAAATSTPADLRVVEPALPSEKGRYRAVNSRRRRCIQFNHMLRRSLLAAAAPAAAIRVAGAIPGSQPIGHWSPNCLLEESCILEMTPSVSLAGETASTSSSTTTLVNTSQASPKVFRIPHPGGSSSLIRSTIDKLLGCNAVFLSQISTFHASCWTVMKAQRKCNVGWFDMVVAAIAPAARRMITQTEKGAKSVLQTIGQPLVMTLVSAASARKMPIATVNRKTSRAIHSVPTWHQFLVGAEARLARAMAQALPAARSNSPIIATTRLLAIAVAAASQCRCCDGGFLGPAPSSEIIASTRLLAIAVAAAMGYR